MTVWSMYSNHQRESYKNFIKMYGSLSAMFNQKSSETGSPYLDSKFQETIYARCFNSEGVDIGNTPHDIKSSFGSSSIGIGIKTWLSSKPSYQKVMQLKAFKDEIDPYINNQDANGLAVKLAVIKNKKLKNDYYRLGLEEEGNVYHYVTRDKGKMVISETSYPLVDLTTLKVDKMTKTALFFHDGFKNYKFTYSDNEIWMKFGAEESDTTLLDTIDVNIFKDPFEFLRTSFYKYENGINDSGLKVAEEENDNYISDFRTDKYLYLPLYSYKSKEVGESSGLNAWNGLPKTKGSSILRPEGEAYIPIPKKIWKLKPNWLDPEIDMSDYSGYKNKTGKSSIKIKLHMPDGKVFDAIIAQANFKSLQTKPQNILGKWILDALGVEHPQRIKPDVPAENIVTMKMLREAGFDSVKLWRKDPEKPYDIWIDFAEFGSFENYMKELSEEN